MVRLNFFLYIAFLLTIFTIGSKTAMADQGCIDCHCDEKKLISNLSQEKPKKSAMTSGAG
jgi:hypothetical protein